MQCLLLILAGQIIGDNPNKWNGLRYIKDVGIAFVIYTDTVQAVPANRPGGT